MESTVWKQPFSHRTTKLSREINKQGWFKHDEVAGFLCLASCVCLCACVCIHEYIIQAFRSLCACVCGGGWLEIFILETWFGQPLFLSFFLFSPPPLLLTLPLVSYSQNGLHITWNIIPSPSRPLLALCSLWENSKQWEPLYSPSACLSLQTPAAAPPPPWPPLKSIPQLPQPTSKVKPSDFK